jgi:hypothetical protein
MEVKDKADEGGKGRQFRHENRRGLGVWHEDTTRAIAIPTTGDHHQVDVKPRENDKEEGRDIFESPVHGIILSLQRVHNILLLWERVRFTNRK